MLTYVPLFRVYNGADHFYTTSAVERDHAISHGYKDEGTACYVSPDSSSNLTPLFRLYNGTDHFYTTSAAERDKAISHGYNNEGTACYVSPGSNSELTPLFRLYNGTDHFYTTSAAERDNAISHGYNDEGTACDVLDPAATLNLVFDSIRYGAFNLPPTSPDLLGTQELVNKSHNSELTQEISYSKTLTSSFSWGLTQRLAASFKMGVQVGVPDLASATTEITVEADLGAHQDWETTESLTYTVSNQVTVPAGDTVQVTGYVDLVDDLTVPFEFYCRLTGYTAGNVLNPETLQAMFLGQNPGFPIQNIQPSIFPNELRIKFDGVFTGSFGINTRMSVSPLSVAIA